jgi:hypothetical protein
VSAFAKVGESAATYICVQTYGVQEPVTIEADSAVLDKRARKLVLMRDRQRVWETLAVGVIAWWEKKD